MSEERTRASATPMSYVMTALAGRTVNALVSLGVVLAIFNANIAIILYFGRILYSSGRDQAWPAPISGWLAAHHPVFKSPWVATALVGLVGGLLTYVSNVAALVTFTGVLLVVLYGLVALSALVSRFTQQGLKRPFRMPLWPLAPVIGLAGTVLVFTQQTRSDIGICIAIFIVAAIYYALYLRPRQSTHWVMRNPIADDSGTKMAQPRPDVARLTEGEPEATP